MAGEPASPEVTWSAFVAAHPEEAAPESPYSVWHFGDDQRMADDLAELACRGIKRATAGALWAYEAASESVPKVGDLSVVTDWSGQATCVVRTTGVETVAFEDVTPEFAAAEGEGDGSLERWRQAHWDFFARELRELGKTPRLDMPVVCERFEVLFGASAPAPHEADAG
jgi:uncharacterized protein YhfF